MLKLICSQHILTSPLIDVNWFHEMSIIDSLVNKSGNVIEPVEK
jgi:hypothetical protein